MKRILVPLFLILLIIGCGNNRSGDKTMQENVDTINHLAVDKAKRATLCDSLRKIEGDTILGSIRLGMSQKEYTKAIKQLQKELGNNLKMDSITYFFDDPSATRWVNGKLCLYSLRGNFPDYLVTLDGSALMESQETTPTFRRALRHFIDKYGNADEYADQEGNVVSNLNNCRQAKWNLGYKTIYIHLEDGTYYDTYKGERRKTRMLLVDFSKPSLMEEYDAYNDSIEKAFKQKELKDKEKDESYGRQL